MPRLGIVLPYLKSRGTERQALALGKHFRGERWAVRIFVLEPWGDYGYEFETAGLELVHCQPPAEEYPPRASAKAARALARAVRSNPVDVLLSRAGMTNTACAIAGRITRTPSIIVQSGPVYEPNAVRVAKAWLRPRQWLAYALATRIVAVSTDGADRLRRLWRPFARKISAIRNGVDAAAVSAAAAGPVPEAFERSAVPDRIHIGYVGSLDERRKGLDVLLQAFARLRTDANAAACDLWLVGSGRDREKLERDAERLGIAARTHLVGEQHNPHAWTRMIDVFVLPSRREGLPNALMEAMALGRCCVAADCPTGPRELIQSGHDGILVPPADPDRLADALRTVASDRDRAALYGRRARDKVTREFRSERCYQSYESLARSLLRSDHAGGVDRGVAR